MSGAVLCEQATCLLFVISDQGRQRPPSVPANSCLVAYVIFLIEYFSGVQVARKKAFEVLFLFIELRWVNETAFGCIFAVAPGAQQKKNIG